MDTIYKKNRANKVKVKYIGQIFKIKNSTDERHDKFYYVSNDGLDKCMACKEEVKKNDMKDDCIEIENKDMKDDCIEIENKDKEMCMLLPCCHKMCVECYEDLSNKKCPYCTLYIDSIKKIKILINHIHSLIIKYVTK